MKRPSEKAYPILRKPSVPGYNKGTGTPSYVKGPAKAATAKCK